jgi:hypothetical protein
MENKIKYILHVGDTSNFFKLHYLEGGNYTHIYMTVVLGSVLLPGAIKSVLPYMYL